jgi:CheY-like chemotaxis protein
MQSISTPQISPSPSRFKATYDDAVLSFLIVDDALMNRKILRRMLEAEPALHGCSISEAGDGSEAVSMVAQAPPHTFHCIFMDSVMTTLHGPEATNILRNELEYKGIILGLTGNAHPVEIESFLQSGLDKVLLKPLKRSTMMESLEHAKLTNRLNVIENSL